MVGVGQEEKYKEEVMGGSPIKETITSCLNQDP